ncbi:hypothetical protein [Mumia zhuanghuii]|uniref:Uncharacterized protein n=1 Tax=Mumia zhuanghuii TaxID=2585211 RepID=A0A5C4MAZ2_9ACTN|nr:hypothetical protein [Mumia zhuanghuii]TNC31279.1 hypothetical protein FHE65_31900 [Mumia zhuanghuii]
MASAPARVRLLPELHLQAQGLLWEERLRQERLELDAELVLVVQRQQPRLCPLTPVVLAVPLLALQALVVEVPGRLAAPQLQGVQARQHLQLGAQNDLAGVLDRHRL